MADPFTGEIRAFCFNYAPAQWAQCNGQQMMISQNSALFSVIGIHFGGDGQTTYKLPNMMGMAPVNIGTPINPGGDVPNPIQTGSTFGSPNVTLLQSQMPSHTHQVTGGFAATTSMTPAPAANSLISRVASGNTNYWSMTTAGTPADSQPPDTVMGPGTVSTTGTGVAHSNMQPFLAVNFCICLYGEYPIRPS